MVFQLHITEPSSERPRQPAWPTHQVTNDSQDDVESFQSPADVFKGAVNDDAGLGSTPGQEVVLAAVKHCVGGLRSWSAWWNVLVQLVAIVACQRHSNVNAVASLLISSTVDLFLFRVMSNFNILETLTLWVHVGLFHNPPPRTARSLTCTCDLFQCMYIYRPVTLKYRKECT